MKLQLKRSSTTTGNVNAVVPVGPTAAQTLPGELCVNFNSGDPALFIEDTAGNIVRVDGNNDTYALSTTSSGSQGDIVLTHDGSGNNDATTDTVSILAGTNIAVSSDGTDITIASSVPSSGQFGYWTRNDGTDTLSPVNTNDNVNIGSGQFTTSVGYNGPLLTNNGSDLTVSTAGTGNNNIHLDTVGTGQVQINTDVVIENEHSLILKELETNGYHEVAHKAASSLTEDATYAWPITPTASAYLTSDASGNLSWTTGTTILTTVVGGAGLDATDTSGSSTTVSVDLKANQGLRTIASSSLADATDDDSELGLIAGSSAQDTLLWTVTGGAAAITPAGASGQTTEPEGAYVGVTTTAAAGSGCTVNFDVAADGTISNLTIANPGSGYGESQVLTIDGHQTTAPAPITFTLETDANNGRYTYTGWRTGALTTAGGGGSGGDLTGIDGGPGIEIDESNTTTPKVSIDLAATNPGLEFTAANDTGELRVKPHNGITVSGSGVAAVGAQGISVGAAGISVDLATNAGLEISGASPNGKLQVKSGPGIEVVSAGVSTRIHTGGALSDQLGGNNNELGLADPTSAGTSNQVVVWKAANSAQTIAVAAAPNNVSDQPEADYVNVATTVDSGAGSGLTVNFTVGGSGAISNLSISNPGSGYDAATPVCSVDGHGNLNVTISAKYATAQWIAEPFTGGGGGGGDVTGVDAGDGIDVSTGGGPEPVVSVDVHADGGLTNRFDGTATANEGELGLVPGVNTDDVMVWRGANSVVALDTITATGTLAIGDYTNVATTGAGTGLTVAFTIDTVDTEPASITVINPGTGYSDDDAIAITGFNLTCAVDGVNANARWQPGVDKNTTYDLSNTSVSSGSRIDLSGSDNTLDSISIVGSGDTTVGHANGIITISSTNTTDTNTTYDLGNTAITGGSRLDLTDDGGNADSVSITGTGATTVNHGSGTIEISSVNTSNILVADGSGVDYPDPADYSEGQLWWNSDENVGKLFVLYNDPNSGGDDVGGNTWIEASPKPEVPDIFPDITDDSFQGNNTLDRRYLRIEANAGNQTVASTGTTTFNGLVEAGSGVNVIGGGANDFGAGMAMRNAGLTVGYTNNTASRVNFTPDGGGAVAFNFSKTWGSTETDVNAYAINLDTKVNRSMPTGNFSSFRAIPSVLTGAQCARVIGVDIQSSDTSGTVNNECWGLNVSSNFADFNPTNKTIGLRSALNPDGEKNFNFFAQGGAPNFFAGDTYIGGSVSRNTRELWESLLTEEQKEQLEAGTLTIPANVSNPGDGSFVRQWWYDQQSAEDQALIDAGELEYPSHFQAANFVDTFDLGDNTRINLLSNGKICIDTAEDSAALNIKVGSSNTPGDSPFITLCNASDDPEYRLRNGASSNTFNFDRFNGGVWNESISIDRQSNVTVLGRGEFGGGVKVTGTDSDNRGITTELIGSQNSQYIGHWAFGPNNDDSLSTDNVIGFGASSTLNNNTSALSIGFGSYISSATKGSGSFNFYAEGTAPNYFKGDIVSSYDPTHGPNNYTGQYAKLSYGVYNTYLFSNTTENSPFDINRAGAADGYMLSFGYINNFVRSSVGNIRLNGEATPDGLIFDAGGTASTAAAFVVSSDRRLKTNIIDAPSAVDLVKSLQPRQYDLSVSKNVRGFIADELQQVVPEAVVGTANAEEAIGTLADYDGTVLETEVTEPEELEYTEEVETDGVATMVTRSRTWTATGTRPVYQGVDQTKLIPLLTKALQEALDKIEVLEQRLSDAGIA